MTHVAEKRVRTYLDKRSLLLIERTNQIGVDFLLTDLNAGLTFLQIALATDSPTDRNDHFNQVFKVYRTVERLLPRVIPGPHERMEIRIKLEDLKFHLEGAGYSCEI
jgi:hypothetical protein